VQDYFKSNQTILLKLDVLIVLLIRRTY